ncbi:MAG TPA: type VI secretion system ImpA family N-terminal domain-containing protein [Lichenihabitans sp.]|nr:type VI secretion system ImpA family N-terminal domain-containing protein [Lichenihabitans sp.]
MIDLDALRRPVSAESPCGPDLELAGDPVFMNLLARVEGLLPESFFAFARSSIDFDAEITAIGNILERTRDLRLLTLTAKLCVLNRDAAAFIDCVDLIASLVTERWADVHPMVVDGDASLRGAVLLTLDDLPSVILPFQHAPLAESRRAGTISYRSQMIAAGEAKRRDGEETPDAAAIEQALAEIEMPALVGKRDGIRRLATALDRIKSTWIGNVGFDDAPSFERLAPLTDKIGAFLDKAIVRRDPSALAPPATSAPPDDAAAVITTASTAAAVRLQNVVSAASAMAALAAAAAYFQANEPSTPALLLVRQAEQLVGKGFLDVMRIMVPEAVAKAEILIGADQPVALALERFEVFSAKDETPGEVAETVPGVAAPSRADALALLVEVSSFYRAAEPTNPIPMLLDRARALVHLDFMSLLKEIAPKRK